MPASDQPVEAPGGIRDPARRTRHAPPPAIAKPDVFRLATAALDGCCGLSDERAVLPGQFGPPGQPEYDPLTGLPVRTFAERYLTSELAAGRCVVALLCDLDQFTAVNDSLGFAVGNQLIAAAARRVVQALPDRWLVTRSGGEEFLCATVVAELEDPDDLMLEAGRDLQQALRRPIRTAGLTVALALSVGAAVSPDDATVAQDVLSRAGQALARAKREGRGRTEIWDDVIDGCADRVDFGLQHDLRGALVGRRGCGEIVAYLQPVVDLRTECTVGYEALARWSHPRHGLLAPQAFLPMAETTGLVVPLGWKMLQLASRAARAVPESCWISVNVSPSQLGRGVLAGELQSNLERYRITRDRLHLELTEAGFVDYSPAIVGELEALTAAGTPLALDDFGTGYSTLELLQSVPARAVKIDRRFSASAPDDPRARAIMRNVLALCRDLTITAIAEGVETPRQRDVLKAMGCPLAQGYLFGAPS